MVAKTAILKVDQTAASTAGSTVAYLVPKTVVSTAALMVVRSAA